MPDVTNYWRNANQNYKNVSIISYQSEWSSSKNLQIVNAGECREKGTLIHCWWDCKLIQALWRII